jgi:hypothetical protein
MTRQQRLKQNRSTPEQLPDRGWLVSNRGQIVYRTGPDTANAYFHFTPEKWRVATEEEIKRMQPDNDIHP